jgi:hypothetical protein
MIANIIKVEDHCPKTKNPGFLYYWHIFIFHIIDNSMLKIQTVLLLVIIIFYLSFIK